MVAREEAAAAAAEVETERRRIEVGQCRLTLSNPH